LAFDQKLSWHQVWHLTKKHMTKN